MIAMRSEVKRYLEVRGFNFMKSFGATPYPKLYLLLKQCTKHMNGTVLLDNPTKWSVNVTHHIVRALCHDTVRNHNSKHKQAEKRRLKRLQAATPYRNAASTEHRSTAGGGLEPASVAQETDNSDLEPKSTIIPRSPSSSSLSSISGWDSDLESTKSTFEVRSIKSSTYIDCH